MPELPEVETIRLQLNEVLRGLVIKDIEVLSAKNFQGEKEKITGWRITSLRRFGKILVIDFENEFSLAIHLKLTGRLIYRGKKQPENLLIEDEDIKKLPNKHTRVIIYFKNNDVLFFNDLRKFGWLKVIKKSKLVTYVSKLGIEPFTNKFTLENFRQVLKSSKKPVKLVLMNQEKIAGIGNIYANEALFLAKIHPRTPACKITYVKAVTLYNEILKLLKNAIKWRGASDDAYRDAFGQKGEVQKHFLVYGRKNKECPNKCGTRIEKIQLGGRGTYFCPHCQS